MSPQSNQESSTISNVQVVGWLVTKHEEDWLDSVCDHASKILCPVPKSLLSEDFQPPLEQEQEQQKRKQNEGHDRLVDGVLEGIEEQTQRQSTTAPAPVEQQEDKQRGTSEKTVTATQGNQMETTDSLDRILEHAEQMACGRSWDREPRTIDHRRVIETKSIPMQKVDDYVTVADLESQGVRFRDERSFQAPIISEVMDVETTDVQPKRENGKIWAAATCMATLLLIALISTLLASS